MYYIDEGGELGYNDLNSTKKIKKTDDLRKAAYNQGYDAKVKPHPKYGSHSIVDITHRKTGESVKKPGGQEAGGKKPGKGGNIDDTTVINTTADAIQKDMKRRGKVDKRGPAKEKRKAEMKANLEAKRKKAHGNMSTVKPQKKRTFEAFMTDCNRVLTEGSH